jgi:hypothetical protein
MKAKIIKTAEEHNTACTVTSVRLASSILLGLHLPGLWLDNRRSSFLIPSWITFTGNYS